jgi:hypothetical protein
MVNAAFANGVSSVVASGNGVRNPQTGAVRPVGEFQVILVQVTELFAD